jgi:SPP1 gp7 family putative phage head morphogenesis protein
MIVSETGRDTVKRIQSALNIGRKSAGDLAYNAIYQAHNWAEYEYHLENDDIIRAVRFTAELDRRTSPLCRSLDGKIFKLDEAPIPPLHWLCRSMLSPIFKYETLNKAIGTRIARIDEQPRMVKHRDGTTSTSYQKLRVQHPRGDITYNKWMLSLVKSNDPRNVAFAREVLGPVRFELVSSGKLKMGSLYYYGKLRTIKDLKRLLK